MESCLEPASGCRAHYYAAGHRAAFFYLELSGLFCKRVLNKRDLYSAKETYIPIFHRRSSLTAISFPKVIEHSNKI